MDVFFVALILLMALVVYFDLTSFTIPNWLNATVLLLYIPFVVVQPEGFNWWMPLLAAGVVFAVGFVIFALNWMGGGDIKLFIATAPWIGWGMKLFEYFLLIAVLGGVLAIVIYVARKALFWVLPKINEKDLPRLLRDKEPVPYGLAIAGAFLWFLFNGFVPGVGFGVI